MDERAGGFQASYTVEASYIMAIVIFSLAFFISRAYDMCREEAAVMSLHHISEWLKGQTEESKRDVSFSQWNGQVVRSDRKVNGILQGDGLKMEIELRVHKPEDMMRFLTIFDILPEGGEHDRAREADSNLP